MVNVNTKKLELIQELKELRQQKGMTYQQIADKTAANGEAVSSPLLSWFSPPPAPTTTTTIMF